MYICACVCIMCVFVCMYMYVCVFVRNGKKILGIKNRVGGHLSTSSAPQCHLIQDKVGPTLWSKYVCT